MSKKKLYTIIGAVIVTIAVVLTTILLIKNPNGTPELQKTEVGKQIQSVLTVDNRPASTIVVAPATEKWWNNLTSTLPEDQLSDQVTWDGLKKNALYISTAVSGGGTYNDYYKFNLSTLIVAYDTKEATNKVASELPLGTNYLVSNNLLLFTPNEAFSDLDYALDAYESTQDRIKTDDIVLKDKALMTIDLRAMVDNLIVKQETKEEKQFLTDFGKLFDLEVGASWVGMSPDGITWDGQFYGVKKLPSTKEINDVFFSTVRAVDGDKVMKPEEITDPEWSGFLEENQYRALTAMSVRTNEQVVGMASVTAGAPGITGPGLLPKDEGIYQIQFAVNNFIALVQNRHMTYPYTNAGVITITLLDKGGKSTIVFEDLNTAFEREQKIIDKANEDMANNTGNVEDMSEEEKEYYENLENSSPTETPPTEDVDTTPSK